MPFFQDPDAQLTLTRVATAPALVAELAKLSSRSLEVSPLLAREVLMVSVEKAKSSDVLARLAIAATATWQPTESGYRLVPDRAARGIEASAERARRLQAITEELKKKQEEAAKQAKEQGADAATAGLAAMFMGQGSIDAFIPLLDLNSIASLESGGRLVFSDRPNAAQRALRGNPSAVVANWIATHNASARPMGSATDGMPEELAGILNGPMGDRMKRMSKVVSTTPAKLIIVASRGGNNPLGNIGLGIRLEARAYGADGTILLEETGSIGTNMMSFLSRLREKPAASQAKVTPIPYSDDAKAFIEFSRGSGMMMGGLGGGPQMSPKLHELLFAPDKFEPLALVPGEGLAALARARRKPLVAAVPDAAYPGGFATAPPQTIEDVEESLKTGSMRLVPDTAFLVVRAAEPETARRVQVDRAALARLLKAVDDHEVPSLDELSAFALGSVPPAENALLTSFIGKFLPGTLASMAGPISWDGLRLYGSLSGGQRDALASGSKIAFVSLGSPAKDALATMLYGAGGGATIERAGVSNETDMFSIGMRMVLGGGGIDARDEPTEIAPRGLPADGYLQATVTNDTIIRPVTETGIVYYSLGIEELAMMHMLSTGPLAAQMGDSMRLPESGRLGSRALWSLRGYVATGAYVAANLQDDRTPKNGQVVSINALPPELQARVIAKAEALKKSPLGTMISMGGVGVPTAKP